MGHLVEDVDLQFLGSLVLFLAPLRRALYPWYAGGGNELAIASIVTTTQSAPDVSALHMCGR